MHSAKLRLVVAFGVGVFVFVSYTLPVRDWRFWRDDYGFAYEGSRFSSWSAIKPSFTTVIGRVVLSSNEIEEHKTGFFLGAYRPLAAIMQSFEARLAGQNHQYYTYLISIALFAMAMSVLFYLFSLVASIPLAVLATLFCAFHASINTWLGMLSMQAYILAVLFLGLLLLLIKKAVDNDCYRYLVPAGALFFIHLLMHEWFLILPWWLAIAIPLYQKRWQSKLGNTHMPVVIVLLFLSLSIGYLAIKCALFSFPPGSSGAVIGMWTRIIEKIHNYEFVSLAVHIAGINWLKEGTVIAKSLLLLLMGSAWLILLVRSPYRAEMMVFMVGAGLFVWPMFVYYFMARYAYLSALFVVASFLIGVRDVIIPQRIFATCLMIFAILGLSYNISSLRALSKRSVLADEQLRNLSSAIQFWPTGKTLVLAGVPEEWFPSGGTAQALWWYSGRSDIPVCVHWRLQTRSTISFEEPEALYIPRVNLLEISQPQVGQIYMKSKEPERLWFYGVGNRFCSLGERVVQQHSMTPYGSRSYEITFKLDDRWTRNGFAVATWNFKKQQFEWLSNLNVADAARDNGE